MSFKLMNREPIERTSNRIKRLDAAFQKLMKHKEFSSRKGEIHDGWTGYVTSSIRHLGAITRQLEDSKKRFGRIYEQGVIQLSQECSAFTAELKKIGGAMRTPSGIPLSKTPLFARVRREAKGLGGDIRLLSKVAEREADSEDEKDLYYQTAKLLRAEIKRQDENLARDLSLSRLDGPFLKYRLERQENGAKGSKDLRT